MHPEKVDRMLRDYREFRGRCEFLRHEIGLEERKLAILRETMIDDAVSMSPNLTGMPKGSGTSKPVEALAIRFGNGYVPAYIQEIEKALDEKKKELREKMVTVVFVEAWLKGLTDKERTIVEKQVIDGRFWREIVFEYRAKYGEEYSREGLKRIKKVAMEKIYRMAM